MITLWLAGIVITVMLARKIMTVYGTKLPAIKWNGKAISDIARKVITTILIVICYLLALYILSLSCERWWWNWMWHFGLFLGSNLLLLGGILVFAIGPKSWDNVKKLVLSFAIVFSFIGLCNAGRMDPKHPYIPPVEATDSATPPVKEVQKIAEVESKQALIDRVLREKMYTTLPPGKDTLVNIEHPELFKLMIEPRNNKLMCLPDDYGTVWDTIAPVDGPPAAPLSLPTMDKIRFKVDPASSKPVVLKLYYVLKT